MSNMDTARTSIGWVDRFERSDGGLVAIGLDADGVEHKATPVQLGAAPNLTSPVCVRANVDLASGRLATMDTYRKFLPKGVSRAHQVFQYELAGRTLLLPALAMTRAFFRPFRVLAPHLYSQKGLDAVCLPADPECRSVEWLIPLVGAMNGASEGHMAALGWAWGFPSGRTMWDSVYDHARKGQVGADLPRARVEILASVMAIDELFLAIRIALVSFEPSEDAFAFCTSDRSPRVLHRLTKTLVPRGANVLDLRQEVPS